MVNSIVEFLRETFPPAVGVMLAAALPITELRAAIPLAVSLGMPPTEAFAYAVVGNIIPIPILLWLLPKMMNSFIAGTWFGKRLDSWVVRTRRRSDKVDAYGALGLILFTAVPLPTTGAWSASLAAVIFRIPAIKAVFAISSGVVVAGILITLLSLGILG